MEKGVLVLLISAVLMTETAHCETNILPWVQESVDSVRLMKEPVELDHGYMCTIDVDGNTNNQIVISITYDIVRPADATKEGGQAIVSALVNLNSRAINEIWTHREYPDRKRLLRNQPNPLFRIFGKKGSLPVLDKYLSGYNDGRLFKVEYCERLADRGLPNLSLNTTNALAITSPTSSLAPTPTPSTNIEPRQTQPPQDIGGQTNSSHCN